MLVQPVNRLSECLGRKMKVLVLDEEFPYPPNSGKRTRSFNLYRRLARKFEIRYVGYGDEASIGAQAVRESGIEPVPVPARIPPKQGLAFYLRLLGNLASPLPYIVTSHFSRAYRDVVCRNVAEFRPNLVLCEWTPYAMYVEKLRAIKKIVSTHNVEADIWQRYYQNETNHLRRWYIREQWRKVRRFEQAALGWVDGAVAVSDADCARFAQRHPGLRTKVIPNGVDLDYFTVLPQPDERRHLVFTGSMDWRPNQDAARYFVAEILPRLRQTRPDVECTFVGRSPPGDIVRLAKVPGVHITGTVEDIRPYVRQSAVCIVPLRVGGGSRLKVLEALAMGRAVVSTRIGAEGLDVVHDHHLVVADRPECFAESVLGLLDNPQRCQQLAAEGRRLVEQRYGWDYLANRFGAFMREVSEGETSAGLPGEMARQPA